MNQLELLTTTSSGTEVWYDARGSHAATHFVDTPNLRGLVIEVLSSITFDPSNLFFEYDMGKVIGTTDLVTNQPGDEIVYAKRANRDIYTSYNKTQQPAPSSLITICLEPLPEANYMLKTAWIGTKNSPPFPGDEKATSESRQYWTTHSLVWGRQEIQPGTETTTCPW